MTGRSVSVLLVLATTLGLVVLTSVTGGDEGSVHNTDATSEGAPASGAKPRRATRSGAGTAEVDVMSTVTPSPDMDDEVPEDYLGGNVHGVLYLGPAVAPRSIKGTLHGLIARPRDPMRLLDDITDGVESESVTLGSGVFEPVLSDSAAFYFLDAWTFTNVLSAGLDLDEATMTAEYVIPDLRPGRGHLVLTYMSGATTRTVSTEEFEVRSRGWTRLPDIRLD